MIFELKETWQIRGAFSTSTIIQYKTCRIEDRRNGCNVLWAFTVIYVPSLAFICIFINFEKSNLFLLFGSISKLIPLISPCFIKCVIVSYSQLSCGVEKDSHAELNINLYIFQDTFYSWFRWRPLNRKKTWIFVLDW